MDGWGGFMGFDEGERGGWGRRRFGDKVRVEEEGSWISERMNYERARGLVDPESFRGGRNSVIQ